MHSGSPPSQPSGQGRGGPNRSPPSDNKGGAAKEGSHAASSNALREAPNTSENGHPPAERPTSQKPVGDAAASHFKTRLCKDYEQRGWCPWGQMCIFAHGAHELRTHSENERMGITNEVAVQRERAKLLTDTNQDRPPPPISSTITAVASYAQQRAVPVPVVAPPPFFIDVYTGEPLYATSLPAASFTGAGQSPYCAPPPMMSTVPVAPTLYPYGTMGPVPLPTMTFPQQQGYSYLVATSPTPLLAGGLNTMSANAAPFVPAGAMGTAVASVPSAAPAREPEAPPSRGSARAEMDDDDEDVTTILRGLVHDMRSRTQGDAGDNKTADANTTNQTQQGPDEEDDDDISLNNILAKLSLMDR